MAKVNEEIKEVAETEEVNEYRIKELNENGNTLYALPEFEIYTDKDGNTIKEIKNLKIQRPFNMTNYNSAYFKFINDGDAVMFARTIFKSVIVSPIEAKNVDFWEHDIETLAEVIGLVVEIVGKKKKEKTKKLKVNL